MSNPEQHQQEILHRFQALNSTCVDCGSSNGVSWATLLQPPAQSRNYPVVAGLLCLRCSGIHRSIGTHITRVKSLHEDAWGEKDMEALLRGGNERVNAIFLARRPEDVHQSDLQSDDTILKAFLQKKYVEAEYADWSFYRECTMMSMLNGSDDSFNDSVRSSDTFEKSLNHLVASRHRSSAAGDGFGIDTSKNSLSNSFENHDSFASASSGASSKNAASFIEKSLDMLKTLASKEQPQQLDINDDMFDGATTTSMLFGHDTRTKVQNKFQSKSTGSTTRSSGGSSSNTSGGWKSALSGIVDSEDDEKSWETFSNSKQSTNTESTTAMSSWESPSSASQRKSMGSTSSNSNSNSSSNSAQDNAFSSPFNTAKESLSATNFLSPSTRARRSLNYENPNSRWRRSGSESFDRKAAIQESLNKLTLTPPKTPTKESKIFDTDPLMASGSFAGTSEVNSNPITPRRSLPARISRRRMTASALEQAGGCVGDLPMSGRDASPTTSKEKRRSSLNNATMAKSTTATDPLTSPRGRARRERLRASPSASSFPDEGGASSPGSLRGRHSRSLSNKDLNKGGKQLERTDSTTSMEEKVKERRRRFSEKREGSRRNHSMGSRSESPNNQSDRSSRGRRSASSSREASPTTPRRSSRRSTSRDTDSPTGTSTPRMSGRTAPRARSKSRERKTPRRRATFDSGTSNQNDGLRGSSHHSSGSGGGNSSQHQRRPQYYDPLRGSSHHSSNSRSTRRSNSGNMDPLSKSSHHNNATTRIPISLENLTTDEHGKVIVKLEGGQELELPMAVTTTTTNTTDVSNSNILSAPKTPLLSRQARHKQQQRKLEEATSNAGFANFGDGDTHDDDAWNTLMAPFP